MICNEIFEATFSTEISSFHKGHDDDSAAKAKASAERMERKTREHFPESDIKTAITPIGLLDHEKGIFRPYMKTTCSVRGTYRETREIRTENQYKEENGFRNRIEDMLNSVHKDEEESYRSGTLITVRTKRAVA